MKSVFAAAALCALVFVMAGCAGTQYQIVDLKQDLDQETLQRYDSEWKALGSPASATLERSNWWPLGLVIYHRDATVTRSNTALGPVYEVQSGHGVGPLSFFYTRSTHALFNATTGERLSWGHMWTIYRGCIAMTHQSDYQRADGSRGKMTSGHYAFHMLNYHDMGGHKYASLFTLPNPIGVSWMDHD